MREQEITQLVASVMDAMADTISVHISLKQAKALIEKVEARAAEMGVNAVIAVSNSCANPVAVHCMDNSYIESLYGGCSEDVDDGIKTVKSA